jgi:zinc protease
MLVAWPALAAMTVESTRLGHGVEVWYVPIDTAPVVDVVLSFEGAGSASDGEGKAGRAAFAASMLTEGAGTLSSQAFREALDAKAISMSMEIDEDRLTVHVYCLREHAAYAGELLALALSQPMLSPEDQGRMKADIRSLITRLGERPSYQAGRLLETHAFRAHPYSNARYGDLASLERLGTQDIRDYMGTHVTRGNVLVAASGDVDARLLDAMLTPVIDGLPANDAGAVAVTQTMLQGAGETLRQEMPVPQTTILFAAPALPRSDARYYTQHVLNHILGGSALFSLLGEKVRKDEGLVYSIDTSLDVKRGATLITGALATRNANADAAIAAVKSVLSDVQNKGVTTEQCDDAKSYVRGAFARQLDSSGAVSGLLLSMQIHDLGKEYLAKRDSYFEAVRCGEINDLASELLNPANFLFVRVGGTGQGDVVPIQESATPRHDAR